MQASRHTPRLSATLRREIIDWIVFGLSGETLYGDARDVPPTDCDRFFVEEWHGRREVAKSRRARLTALSREELLTEALTYYDFVQKIGRLDAPEARTPKRGWIVGAGR